MTEEFKKKWVEALRSGKYKQAKSSLRFGNKYCCLGVACDLSGLGEWTTGYGGEKHYYIKETTVGMFPSFCIGLTREQSGHLARMNDDGIPFSEIADYIEKNIEAKP